MENTYLFVDWVHVDKGRMEVTLDADRLSPEGKEFVERYEREWSIYRDFSGTPRAVSLSITPAGHGTLQNAGNIAVRMANSGGSSRTIPVSAGRTLEGEFTRVLATVSESRSTTC